LNLQIIAPTRECGAKAGTIFWVTNMLHIFLSFSVVLIVGCTY